MHNSLWLLAEKALLMVGGLLLSMAFARLLGADGFGRYNYVVAFVALFAPLFSLGMANIILKALSADPDHSANILTTCLTGRLLAGIMVSLLTLLVLYAWLGWSWKLQTIGLLLLCHISNGFEVYERWFVQQSLNPLLVRWRLLCFSVFMALKLLLVWHIPDFALLLVLLGLEVLVRNLGYRYLYHNHDKELTQGKFDPALFKSIFAQSRFLIFSSLAAIVYLKIDILMLEWMRPIDEVGIYAVAARMSEVWYVLPQVLISALFPKLLELANRDEERYRRWLQRGFDWLFMVALAVSLLMVFIGPWLVRLLFGEGYQLAGQILQLHIFAGVFIYMRVLLSQWLIAQSFAQFSLLSQLSGALTNILLNLWLIPLYGPWGAAVATVISYGVSGYGCLWFCRRTREIGWMMTRAMLFPLRVGQLFTKI